MSSADRKRKAGGSKKKNPKNGAVSKTPKPKRLPTLAQVSKRVSEAQAEANRKAVEREARILAKQEKERAKRARADAKLSKQIRTLKEKVQKLERKQQTEKQKAEYKRLLENLAEQKRLQRKQAARKAALTVRREKVVERENEAAATAARESLEDGLITKKEYRAHIQKLYETIRAFKRGETGKRFTGKASEFWANRDTSLPAEMFFYH